MKARLMYCEHCEEHVPEDVHCRSNQCPIREDNEGEEASDAVDFSDFEYMRDYEPEIYTDDTLGDIVSVGNLSDDD